MTTFLERATALHEQDRFQASQKPLPGGGCCSAYRPQRLYAEGWYNSGNQNIADRLILWDVRTGDRFALAAWELFGKHTSFLRDNRCYYPTNAPFHPDEPIRWVMLDPDAAWEHDRDYGKPPIPWDFRSPFFVWDARNVWVSKCGWLR